MVLFGVIVVAGWKWTCGCVIIVLGYTWAFSVWIPVVAALTSVRLALCKMSQHQVRHSTLFLVHPTGLKLLYPSDIIPTIPHP